MSFEWRGGIPVVQRITGIDATGTIVLLEKDQCRRATSKWMRINNVGGANAVRIFFFEDDFDNDVNYLTLEAADEPLAAPIEATQIWVKSPVGTDIEILTIARRG